MLALGEALSSSSRTQVKGLVQSQSWGGEDRWISKALWSSSLAELVNSRLDGRPCLKKIKLSVVVGTSSLSLFTCIHMLRKKAYRLLYFLVIFKRSFFLTREFLFFRDGFGQMVFETSANQENCGISVLWNLVLKLWFRSPDQMDTWRLKSQNKAFTRLVLQQLGISEDNRLLYFSKQKPL